MEEILNQGINLPRPEASPIDPDFLECLPVEGKLQLLGKIVTLASFGKPPDDRRGFWARFEYCFYRITTAERLRNQILPVFLNDPSRIWLRELGQLDNAIENAICFFEEFLDDEFELPEKM